jgi:AraC-like DNA-binding protein
MNITIENGNRDTIYQEQVSQLNHSNQARSNVKISNRSELDFWNVDSWSIDLPGVRFARFRIDVKEDIFVKTSEPDPLPGLLFIHKGNISSRFHDDGLDHHFSTNHHSILFNPFATEKTYYKKQVGLDISMVIFKPEYFLQVAMEGCDIMHNISDRIILKKNSVAIHNPCCRMTMDMYRILNEISDCGFHGELRTLYLQAKAMELLVLQCAQLADSREQQAKHLKLSGADLTKLHAARDIIHEHFQHPPSLMDLSRMVGLNDFKLKAGFKKEFSTTVFGYVNDLRLNIAKKDFLKKEKSLTEIAYDSGYSSLSHFSNAFKKKFGVSPASARECISEVPSVQPSQNLDKYKLTHRVRT